MNFNPVFGALLVSVVCGFTEQALCILKSCLLLCYNVIALQKMMTIRSMDGVPTHSWSSTTDGLSNVCTFVYLNE